MQCYPEKISGGSNHRTNKFLTSRKHLAISLRICLLCFGLEGPCSIRTGAWVLKPLRENLREVPLWSTTKHTLTESWKYYGRALLDNYNNFQLREKYCYIFLVLLISVEVSDLIISCEITGLNHKFLFNIFIIWIHTWKLAVPAGHTEGELWSFFTVFNRRKHL